MGAAVSGGLVAMGQEELVSKYIFMGLNEATGGTMISTAMCGWAVGKFHAISQGADSIKGFCKLNLIPMAVWIGKNVSSGADVKESLFPAIFVAMYSYVAFA